MKTLHELKAEYLARNWQAADDVLRQHLGRFCDFVMEQLAAEPVAPTQAPAEAAPAEPSAGAEADPAVAAATESKAYADGTRATGPGPLPDTSPGGAPAIPA